MSETKFQTEMEYEEGESRAEYGQPESENKKQTKTGNRAQSGTGNAILSNSTAKIFKLNLDCFDELFDYLSLGEIYQIGHTCKTMQKIAGVHFQRNYIAAEITCENDGFFINNFKNIRSLDIFSEFLQKVKICGNGLYTVVEPKHAESFHYLETNCSTNLRHLELSSMRITEETIECLKKFSDNIETIKISNCAIDGDFGEKFLIFFPNLKYLCVDQIVMSSYEIRYESIGTGSEWLTQKYPKLKRLDLFLKNPTKLELKQFFEQNPNVRYFSTYFIHFMTHRDWITTANVKLDDLSINIDDYYDNFNNPNDTFDLDTRNLCQFLQELYERGFYKRLHLCTTFSDDDSMAKVVSFPALHGVSGSIGDVDQPLLLSVKELKIKYGFSAKAPALNFPNLTRVSLWNTISDNILYLIRCAPKLKEIKAESLRRGLLYDGRILDLYALNKERKKLERPCKVTIYVDESVFLATKWTLKNIDLSLIEMKRGSSYEWD